MEKLIEALTEKVGRIDEAIRGNGQPGIQVRLAKMETAGKIQAKLMWIVVTATITLIAAMTYATMNGGV